MASGRPDFHPTMLLEGKYGTTLLPVITDATGQLYVVMTGQGGKVVALDADGNISARIKGLSGSDVKDVAVDSEGVMLSRIQGQSGGDRVDVAVDGDGNLLSVMKGLYGTTLKTIAVDVSGIMKANLTAQDLSYLRIGSGYGNVDGVSSGTVAVPADTPTEIFSLSGPGVVMRGQARFVTDITPYQQRFLIEIDGETVLDQSLYFLYMNHFIKDPSFPLHVLEYNPASGAYIVGIGGSLAFQLTFKLIAYHTASGSKNCKGWLVYSLQP